MEGSALSFRKDSNLPQIRIEILKKYPAENVIKSCKQ